MKNVFAFILVIAAAAISSSTALAATDQRGIQFFPPENPAECTNATFLSWDGASNVRCKKPSNLQLLGTVECLTPEGGRYSGSQWRARYTTGAGSGCAEDGRPVCAQGTPMPISSYYDHMTTGEVDDFCTMDNTTGPLANGCHVSLYWCIETGMSDTTSTATALPPANKPVRIACTISAGWPQFLTVTLKDGSEKTYELGANNGTAVNKVLSDIYPSQPIALQISHHNLTTNTAGANMQRYTGITGSSVTIMSEDGADEDYNDTVCTLTW